MIKNPILPGFNPDPSICRRGEDYYIATSTFEWFPGVQIHHSRDLENWRLITRPLTRVSQLDLRGNPPSTGVWAPCLSHDERSGLFYLVYTDVKNVLTDMHNYLVTAPDITGPWSEPVYLNSSGFDPSLFHDEDGRKWLVQLRWETRPGYPHPGPIILREYSTEKECCTGPVSVIYTGCGPGCLEGPHLYKYNGWYYLVTAEGGTGYGHAVTVSRSRAIDGPYDPCPDNPLCTSANPEKAVSASRDFLRAELYNPGLRLQKSGHGSLVHTHTGEWYLVHLCARPLLPALRCTLGRETAIQKVAWNEAGRLELAHGGRFPADEVQSPAIAPHAPAPGTMRDDFDGPGLDISFQTLRVPADESWLSLTRRPGWLSLRGRESLRSWNCQSLVARRVQSFVFEARTRVSFTPSGIRRYAGLVCFYNDKNYYYLNIYHSQRMNTTCLGIRFSDNGTRGVDAARVPVAEGEPCHLRAVVDRDRLRFMYSPDNAEWSRIGACHDFSTLSDEYCKGTAFTGSFVGICCQDLEDRTAWADFDYFEYREL